MAWFTSFLLRLGVAVILHCTKKFFKNKDFFNEYEKCENCGFVHVF